MSFLRPEFLWLAGLPPMALAALLASSWATSRSASRSATKAPGAFAAAVKPARWKQALAPASMLAALATMGLSVAGPQAVLGFASPRSTVMLTLDVSGSMDAKDIAPSRLLASQAAAQGFVDDAPGGMMIGVVVFSDTARLIVAPTFDRRILKAAIAGSTAEGGTAIGDGLMLALSQIVPHETLDRTNDLRQPERRTPSMNMPSMKRMAWSVPSPTPTEPSSAILLLTDGQNTDGVSPDDAAAAAAAHGVRVFAVGFGTEKGVVPGAGMSTVRVPMNEHMLRTIAEQTRAEYFHASTGSELQEIYRKVEGRLSSATHPTEVTALFAVVAALVVAVSGLASLAWFGRIV